ncbi:uncharacterized protein MYCFIDRAFT_75413 [Pseudocercospora fijiensis CIRAD86]|uniref:Uncharacterized protein n=1 Tax=Pseudocercospora fijiensis (strain CIRAD86) TaxID=383855 RepID=N1Q7G8_PSEFD|nr:uncharacterized protein MYCFIDRAFT_75413 [Pseudocercospora fijiensis CIRAD86]EME87571.1 hypothetical protein MYCFIDRAFT_75413 [Pseudocercospora fijiensis CIRAD86]
MALTRKRKKASSTAAKASKARKSESMPASGASPTSDASPPQAAEQERKTGFLDLAPELREMIYDSVLEICPTAFSKRAKHLTSTAGLARVNKQIRSEFLARALTNAPILKTTVCNFDFSHVVTFLNKLPESDLADLESDEPQRTMLIELKFPGPYFADLKLLKRWLNRADTRQYGFDQSLGRYVSKRKKGALINYQYSAKAAHPALYLDCPKGPLHYGSRVQTMSLSYILSFPGGRYGEETAKIKQTLEQSHIEFEQSRLADAFAEEDLKVLKEREEQQLGSEKKVWPWHLQEEDI